jgi:hypothetical protein
MAGFNPIPKSVKIVKNSAVIEFKDGHRAEFESYHNVVSLGMEGLRRFLLFKSNNLVVQYVGRMSYGRQRSDVEHGFAQVARGYTIEKITGYWEAAVRFADDEYLIKLESSPYDNPQSEAYKAKSITQAADQDLHYIKSGLIRLPDANGR